VTRSRLLESRLYRAGAVRYNPENVHIPVHCGLISVIYVRPQELIGFFARFPCCTCCSLSAVFGLLLDLRLGHITSLATPQLPYVIALWGWMISRYSSTRQEAMTTATNMAIVVVLFVLVSQGIQSFRAFSRLDWSCGCFGFFLKRHRHPQGQQPLAASPSTCADATTCPSRPRRRPWRTTLECRGAALSRVPSIFASVWPVGTTSDRSGTGALPRGAARPQQMAIAVSAALALVFAWQTRRKSLLWRVIAVVSLVMTGYCVFLTQSRGGLLAAMGGPGDLFLSAFSLAGSGSGAGYGRAAFCLEPHGSEPTSPRSCD